MTMKARGANVVVLDEGFDEWRLQSLQTRAPEVWKGLGCLYASDVWSLGVTVSPSSENTLVVLITTASACFMPHNHIWNEGKGGSRSEGGVVHC